MSDFMSEKLDFAYVSYVSFVDNNDTYLNLIKYTIQSVLLFSRYKIIVYLVNIPEDLITKHFNYINENDINRIIFKQIKVIFPSIFHYKSYIIKDAIENYTDSGYYIKSDDIITPVCDTLHKKAMELTDLPISPMDLDTIFTSHVLFNKSNIKFINEWFDTCMIFENKDDKNMNKNILTCMYQKYNNKNYLSIIDPWYENFYTDENNYKQTACSFHGYKNVEIAKILFNDMKSYYLKNNKKKVISFCLWGDIPRYNIGAIKNAKLALEYYPDWECWFYIHKPTVPIDTINQLSLLSNVVIIYKQNDISFGKCASWRFESIDNILVERIICRDVDTRILKREVAAVKEWEQSNKLFHIMRDSPCHYPKILAGMFGMKKIPQIPNMTLEVKKFFENNKNNTDTQNDGNDQHFLENRIYDLIINECLIHDEIMKREGDLCKDYPIKYDLEFHHVGEYVFEDESRDQYYTDRLKSHLLQFLPHRIEKDEMSHEKEIKKENKLMLKTCLVSCDMNPLYYTFYPLVKKYWNDIGVNTKLILISNSIPIELEIYKEDIILFNPILNINPAFQAQCIRILYPSLMDEKDEGIIISDMDMIPMNKSYYFDNIKNYDNKKFIVYRDCISEHKQYPICFCLATSNVWKDIFNINSIDDIITTLKIWYTSDYKISDPYSIGWATDQLKLYKYVNEWNKKTLSSKKSNLILLKDENTNFNRLDRLNLEKDNLNISNIKEDIKNNKYSDFHLPRPYEKHKNLINELLNKEEENNKIINIDRIYIVHYSKLTDRRENLNRQIIEQKLETIAPIIWLDNFDRENLTQELINEYYIYDKYKSHRVITVGEISNAIAHMNIMENIVLYNETALVLEDDIILKPNFIENLYNILNKAPVNWEILTLGGWYYNPKDSCKINNNFNDNIKDNLNLIVPTKKCTTVSCYLLTTKAAKKIIAHKNYKPFSTAIDETLCHIVDTFNIYWAQPWLAVEGSKELNLFSTSFPNRFV